MIKVIIIKMITIDMGCDCDGMFDMHTPNLNNILVRFRFQNDKNMKWMVINFYIKMSTV